MKQVVLKHEIAITRIFAVLRLLLQVLAFALTALLVIAALYKMFTQFSLPVSSKKAIEAISNFISLWMIFCIIGMATALFCNHNVIDRLVDIAVGSFFLESLIFSAAIVIAYYHITDQLFALFIIYSTFYILTYSLHHIFHEFICRAKKEEICHLTKILHAYEECL